MSFRNTVTPSVSAAAAAAAAAAAVQHQTANRAGKARSLLIDNLASKLTFITQLDC